jgi:DNA-3-methyladenine glycosylase
MTPPDPTTDTPLDGEFYNRPADVVAEALLGCYLFRLSADGVTTGWIVETEAYLPDNDPASHAARGSTRSNQSMFGRPGSCYVYPIHARYCANVVTDSIGIGSAVLLRAVEPCQGRKLMQQRRGNVAELDWCRGPARLCQSFAIDRNQDGVDMTDHSGEFWIAAGDTPGKIARSYRIGVTSAQTLRLRYFVDGNQFVSGRRKDHSLKPIGRFADAR